MPKIDLASLAGMVQQYISRKYAAALIDRTKVAELKAYIAQYLYDTGFTVDGYTEKTLAERLYHRSVAGDSHFAFHKRPPIFIQIR